MERSVGTHTVTADGLPAIEFSVTKPAPLSATIPLLLIFAILVAGLALLIYARASKGTRPPQGI